MRIEMTTRLVAACLMAGALACAKNTEKVDETTGAAQDTTSTQAAPPGYSGMERDTSMHYDSTNAQLDTFLNEQGTGVPSDTQGYGGLEHPDTSGQNQPSGATGADTSQMQPSGTGADTSQMQQPGAAGIDSSSYQSDSTAR
jgi:hypothetical protein